MPTLGSENNLVPWTIGLLLVPTSAWFLFVLPHLEKDSGRGATYAMACLVCACLLSAIYYLLAVMTTEPGVLFVHRDAMTSFSRSLKG